MTRDGALERGRLAFIRHVRPGDRVELMRVKRASRAFHEPWEPEPPHGQSWYGERAFRRMLETTNTDTTQRHVVCRASDGAIVGMVSLSQIFRGPFNNAVMGYWTGAEFANQGFGSAGVRLVLRRAFGALRLHRVEANIMPENVASLALVRRVGFREEGRSPKYLQIAGDYRDHTRWAMTVEDWKRLKTR